MPVLRDIERILTQDSRGEFGALMLNAAGCSSPPHSKTSPLAIVSGKKAIASSVFQASLSSTIAFHLSDRWTALHWVKVLGRIRILWLDSRRVAP